jgi:ABC-2 type transport system ATP-binding protein
VIGADRVEFTTVAPTAAVHAITGWAVGRGIELTGLAVSRPSLEDVFLQLAAGRGAT